MEDEVWTATGGAVRFWAFSADFGTADYTVYIVRERSEELARQAIRQEMYEDRVLFYDAGASDALNFGIRVVSF